MSNPKAPTMGNPKKTPVDFTTMSFKSRFYNEDGKKAAYTFAPPAFTHRPNYHLFAKTEEEKDELKLAKAIHNKKWNKLFGTKRPTAGVVARHFAREID